MSKVNILDQYYTNPDIAKLCFDKVINLYQSKFDIYIEPSAGDGSFFNLLPSNRVGYDLDPKHHEVIMQDYLKINCDIFSNKKVITIGNPTFGKNSSLAVKFFNKSAEHSSVIAFILPKTFKKVSIQNKLNVNFRLIKTFDLPKNSFILNNQTYDVPCCFQIWQKSNKKRCKIYIKIIIIKTNK